MFAVFLATAGVMAVIYGGASTQGDNKKQFEISRATPTTTAPLLGDLLTLVASVVYGLYQVLYKRYIALPTDLEREEAPRPSYVPIPGTSFDNVSDIDEDLAPGDSQPTSDTTVYPPPFGLHPNLFTSSAGILTLLFLWIPLPVLHYVGAEPFHWPTNWYVALVISGIALSGAVLNAGSMVTLCCSVRPTRSQRTSRTDPSRSVGSHNHIHWKPPDYCVDIRIGRDIRRWNGGGDILEFHGFRSGRRGIRNFGRRPCRQTVTVRVSPLVCIHPSCGERS